MNSPHLAKIAGKSVSFRTTAKDAIRSLRIELGPKQELNGAANPYPEGRSKNKLKPNVNLPLTQNGVTITLENSQFVFNGTCTEDFDFHFDNWDSDYTTIPWEGLDNLNLYFSASATNIPSSQTTNYPKVGYYANETVKNLDNALEYNFTTIFWVNLSGLQEGDEIRSRCYYTLKSGVTYNNFSIKLSFNADGSRWEPYGNKCPISGVQSITLKNTTTNLARIRPENEVIVSGQEHYTYSYSENNTVTITPYDEMTFYSDDYIVWEIGTITEDMVGEKYWISSASQSSSIYICLPSYNNNWQSGCQNMGSKNNPFSISQIHVGKKWGVRISIGGKKTISKIQVESGTKATPFVPYREPLECTVDMPFSKNLLDMSDENIVVGKYISNSGTITTHASNFYNSKYIPVQPNTPYTVSTSCLISYVSFMEYDTNKGFIKRTLFGSTSKNISHATITTSDTTAFLLIGSNPLYDTITLDDVKAINWQLEEGSAATNFEPYGNIKYSGWVDLYTGKGQATSILIDLGTLEWTAQNHRYNTTAALPNAESGLNADCLCEIYAPNTDAATQDTDATICLDSGVVYIYDALFEGDETAFKSYLLGAHLLYKLATPIPLNFNGAHIPLFRGANKIVNDYGNMVLNVYVHQGISNVVDYAKVDQAPVV